MSYEQVPVLKDRRNMLDVLEDIATNTSGSGGGSSAISDFETLLVLDANDAVMIRRELWNGTTTTITYENLAGDPVTPVLPIRPWAQPQGTASEATLAAMSAKLPASLGSKTGAASMSVVLASDQVMPLTRGIYQTGNGTAISNGQAGSIRVNGFGAVLVNQWLAGDTVGDTLANTAVKLNFPPDGGSGQMPIVGLSGFNGTSWDRIRATVNGLWTQGNVGHGVADAGNPVKMGGVYKNAPTSLTAGVRADLQMSNYGWLGVALYSPTTQASMGTSTNQADNVVESTVPILQAGAFNYFWNSESTRWVRPLSTADGAAVDIAPKMKTAFIMAISATATAAIAFTGGTRRISIVARGADIRYKLGTTSAVVALNTIAAASKDPSILVLQGERIDVNVVGSTHISVIADNDSASKSGSADITEM